MSRPNKHFFVATNAQLLADVSKSLLHHSSALPVARAALGARIAGDLEECDGSRFAISALIKSLDSIDHFELVAFLLAHVAGREVDVLAATTNHGFALKQKVN